MPMLERKREPMKTLPPHEEVERRAAEGWRLSAIEWVREIPADTQGAAEEVPYGMRIAADCAHLENDPQEQAVIAAAMSLVVQDQPMSAIAAELNQRGFVTRRGMPWGPADVFGLMPRLVEAGPKLFTRPEWPRLRRGA
ncbi:MAG TPA: hypothetical protein DEH78_28710 [Solibacterales bacterium]|nr:hypothetical protein [Bryobacterales bacterium]